MHRCRHRKGGGLYTARQSTEGTMIHRCMAGTDEEGRAQVLKEVAQASLATDHWTPSAAQTVCTLVLLCAVAERLYDGQAGQGQAGQGQAGRGGYGGGILRRAAHDQARNLV